MKRISIRDVAAAAGVSISTVSRVLNGSAPVSNELKLKVLAAVERLGYNPSILAKGLRKGSTGIIGFIIPDITNPFFSTIVRGAEDYLKKKDYCLIIASSDQSETQEEKLLRAFSQRVDGLLFTGTGKQNRVLDELIQKGLKIVFLDRMIKGINSSYVLSDNYNGMKQLMEYLIAKGYRKYYLINGQRETMSAQVRHQAFVETLRNSGISHYRYVFSKFTYDAGYEITMKMEDLPDVIVCGNDLIAYGAIAALEKRGYTVPDDVAVTGFDDILFSVHHKPALTTVRQPMYEMGKTAAKLLLNLINGKDKEQKGIILPNTLVIRESA